MPNLRNKIASSIVATAKDLTPKASKWVENSKILCPYASALTTAITWQLAGRAFLTSFKLCVKLSKLSSIQALHFCCGFAARFFVYLHMMLTKSKPKTNDAAQTKR